MENYSINGIGAETAQFETPFADVPVAREQEDQRISSEDLLSNYSFQEVESPFSRTYEAVTAGNQVTEAGEAYTDLVAELNNAEFNETIYEIVNEVEDTWRGKISNEIAMGSNYIPFVTQQARDYFAPMIRETEAMIDRISEHFSGNNMADQSESEVEHFFETLEFRHDQYTPAEEQFFGKIFDNVTSVVNKGG